MIVPVPLRINKFHDLARKTYTIQSLSRKRLPQFAYINKHSLCPELASVYGDKTDPTATHIANPIARASTVVYAESECHSTTHPSNQRRIGHSD